MAQMSRVSEGMDPMYEIFMDDWRGGGTWDDIAELHVRRRTARQLSHLRTLLGCASAADVVEKLAKIASQQNGKFFSRAA